MKLIHVTDLHLRAPGTLVSGRDPLLNLQAAIADINASHADARLVVFSGDLSDDGSAASYRALASALDALLPPFRLMLGNHDDRAAFLGVFPETPADGGFIQSVDDTEAGRIVCLDTLEPGKVAGRLGDERLAWLDRQLAGTQGGPAFVFMHHPPFAIGMEPLDAVRLSDADAFAELIGRHGNVRHIFAGHVHRLTSGVWKGVPFNTGRGTNHQSAALFGATDFATSFEAPTYNVVLTDGEATVVHAQEFSGND